VTGSQEGRRTAQEKTQPRNKRKAARESKPAEKATDGAPDGATDKPTGEPTDEPTDNSQGPNRGRRGQLFSNIPGGRSSNDTRCLDFFNVGGGSDGRGATRGRAGGGIHVSSIQNFKASGHRQENQHLGESRNDLDDFFNSEV